ncbi:MAG: hypothetical protein ACOX6T_04745 [Myxococcales bacterium]|jgi:histone H3/H4
MRHLLIALAVSLLAPGLVDARPPNHYRPAERSEMRFGGDIHRRRSMPTPRMDSAVAARVREKLARPDQVGRPSGFDNARMARPAARGFGRSAMPAPNPYAKLEKAAVGKAMRNLAAKAHFAGSAKGLRSERAVRTSSPSSRARPAPNPYAKLEKAAVGKAMQNLAAKARFAGGAKGLRSERAMRTSGVVGRAVPAPNPYAKLEKAAVAKAMQNLAAKAHFAGSAKGLGASVSRPNNPEVASMAGSAVKVDLLGAAGQSRLARKVDAQ